MAAELGLLLKGQARVFFNQDSRRLAATSRKTLARAGDFICEESHTLEFPWQKRDPGWT